LSTKVLSWFVALLTAGVVTFLVIGEYARKETVVGYLTPVSGTSKIFVPQQRIIREIHVVQGQSVDQGQPLLTVETSQSAADGRDVNAAMLDTLLIQKEHLDQQIQAEQDRGNSERDRLNDLIRGLQSEVVQFEAQIETQTERNRISEEFVASA